MSPGVISLVGQKLGRGTERLLAIVGLCFLSYHLALDYMVMTSDSMAPTLQGTSYENGDRVLLEKITGRWRAPKRWEIYSYFDDDNTLVAKRVVGFPGERIAIKNHKIYINNVELERPKDLVRVTYYSFGNLSTGRTVDCGTGYFMMGDASNDSRFTGVVTRERLRGRVWGVISPWERIGFVH